MVAVGELVLVLGLLVSAHCEVRARDPEVEEEEERGGRSARGGVPPQPGSTHNPLLGGRNPGYRQQQRTVPPGLQWTCCPGQGAPQETGVLSASQMTYLVLSELQPVLWSFNRSLEQLSQQVGDLVRDLIQLKGAGLQAEPPEPDVAVEVGRDTRLDARLEDLSGRIQGVQMQLDSQRLDLDQKLHSQHAMLHYNLTSFKTDTDMKLKRHQKILQVSLQNLNASLTELKLDQDQLTQDQLIPEPVPPADTSALWRAVERLDNMVVNTTVKVDGLMEDMDMTSGDVQQVRRGLKDLEERVNDTARTSQVLFMETGLEVEAAQVQVLQRVEELAGNLSRQGQRLQEMDVDVDYLYTFVYKNLSADCDCAALRSAVTRLEEDVANVTDLANENRLTLDEGGATGPWGGDWEPAVEALQHGVQQVKEVLASEETRTRTLELGLARLGDSVWGLQQKEVQQEAEMTRLSGSFNSLLKDAIRHSDVLEALLGEEVLEFLDWPVQDQETYSIPTLQQQLREQEQRLTSLLGEGPGSREEVPSADQPSSSHLLLDDWLSGSRRRSLDVAPAREQQRLLQEVRRPPHQEVRRPPPPAGDGGDLWQLEQTVEELNLRVQRLQEEKEEAKLQEELRWLKRGLEEHLRVFKNVFSNADILAASDATLPLDKLWKLLKEKDERKEKKRGGAGGGAGGAGGAEGVKASGRGSHRNKRSVPVFLNHQHFSGDAATFVAPEDGIYLFTLDLRPGPAHIGLRRGRGRATLFLQQLRVMEAGPITAIGVLPLRKGEELRPPLMGGEWAESENNMFARLLLLRQSAHSQPADSQSADSQSADSQPADSQSADSQ